MPDEKDRFYESKATLIANEILESELKGKVDEKWVGNWAESGGEFEVRRNVKCFIFILLTCCSPHTFDLFFLFRLS